MTFWMWSNRRKLSARPPAKTPQQKKITFPAVYGIERSRDMAEQERLAAHLALQPFGDRAQRLRELADLVVRRMHDSSDRWHHREDPRGPAAGRARAGGVARKGAGADHRRRRSGRTDRRAIKPGHSVAERLRRSKCSSGCPTSAAAAIKLAAALDHFGIDVTGRICLDVGSSTGGFTDCLLQRGAARVWAIDVGHGQIDWKLRNDPRVVVREGVNARYLTAEDFPEKFDLAVCDASFISAHAADSRDCSAARRNGRNGHCWSSRNSKSERGRSAKAASCAIPRCIRPPAIACEAPSKRWGSGLISSRVRSWAPKAIGNFLLYASREPNQ